MNLMGTFLLLYPWWYQKENRNQQAEMDLCSPTRGKHWGQAMAEPPQPVLHIMLLPSQGHYISSWKALWKDVGCHRLLPRHEHYQEWVEMVICSLIPRASPSKDWALLISNPSHCWIVAPPYPCARSVLYFSSFLFPGSIPPSPCVCGQESDLFQPYSAELCKAHLIKHLPQLWIYYPWTEGTPVSQQGHTSTWCFSHKSILTPDGIILPASITSLFCHYSLLRVYQISVRFLFLHTDTW